MHSGTPANRHEWAQRWQRALTCLLININTNFIFNAIPFIMFNVRCSVHWARWRLMGAKTSTGITFNNNIKFYGHNKLNICLWPALFLWQLFGCCLLEYIPYEHRMHTYGIRIHFILSLLSVRCRLSTIHSSDQERIFIGGRQIAFFTGCIGSCNSM